MNSWELGSRTSANECPCEPLEEHARPCNVSGPCQSCPDLPVCAFACPACKRHVSLLNLLRSRRTAFVAGPQEGEVFHSATR